MSNDQPCPVCKHYHAPDDCWGDPAGAKYARELELLIDRMELDLTKRAPRRDARSNARASA
jgi:hypothetical protein